MRLGSLTNLTPNTESIENAMGKINGVSKQFVEDIDVILEKYQNDTLVNILVNEFVSETFSLTKKNLQLLLL